MTTTPTVKGLADVPDGQYYVIVDDTAVWWPVKSGRGTRIEGNRVRLADGTESPIFTKRLTVKERYELVKGHKYGG